MRIQINTTCVDCKYFETMYGDCTDKCLLLNRDIVGEPANTEEEYPDNIYPIPEDCPLARNAPQVQFYNPDIPEEEPEDEPEDDFSAKTVCTSIG